MLIRFFFFVVFGLISGLAFTGGYGTFDSKPQELDSADFSGSDNEGFENISLSMGNENAEKDQVVISPEFPDHALYALYDMDAESNQDDSGQSKTTYAAIYQLNHADDVSLETRISSKYDVEFPLGDKALQVLSLALYPIDGQRVAPESRIYEFNPNPYGYKKTNKCLPPNFLGPESRLMYLNGDATDCNKQQKQSVKCTQCDSVLNSKKMKGLLHDVVMTAYEDRNVSVSPESAYSQLKSTSRKSTSRPILKTGSVKRRVSEIEEDGRQ